MAIRLTTSDISRLVNAATVMLSPLDFPSGESWVRSVCCAIQQVADADASSSALPVPGHPYLGGDSEIVDILRRTFPPPDWAREALTTKRRSRGLSVADWRDLFDVSKVKRSVFYNDVVLPNRLLAPISMMLDIKPAELPAAFSVYYEDEAKAARKARERTAKLQLLLPAFRAGVSAYMLHEQYRSLACALAERVSTGIALLDFEGRVVFQNQALAQMAAADHERRLLYDELARIGVTAHAIVARGASLEQLGAFSRELTTHASHYSITVTLLRDGAPSAKPYVVAIVESGSIAATNPDKLADRFGLSRREVECALLLKKGASSKQIAAALDISVNTARRHVERILLKLNVHSRAAAAAALHRLG